MLDTPVVLEAPVVSEPTFGNIPLSVIVVKPQIRKHFDDASLLELANSIRQHGVAQPILVRPLTINGSTLESVELVAGERRFRASQMAGKETIPAIVRQLTDAQALEIQVVENLQRKDVHAIEEAEGYEQLMKVHGYTADQLAEKVGKSRAYIYGRLKLCAMVPEAREAFFNKRLNASTALLIARMVPHLQAQATVEITGEDDEPMSYRDAVEHLRLRYMLDLKFAPFAIKDAKLVAAAGSCETCPKRTGNQPEVFKDVESADVCTDPNCFQSKRTANQEKSLAQAKKKGIPVHEGDAADNAHDDISLTSLDKHAWTFERLKGNNAYKPLKDLIPTELLPAPAAYVKLKGNLQAMYEKTAIQTALEKAGVCATEAEYEAEIKANQQNSPITVTTAKVDQAKAKAAEETRQRRETLAERETEARGIAYRRARDAMKDGLSAGALRIIVRELLVNYSVPVQQMNDIYPWENAWKSPELEEFIRTASIENLQLLVMDMVFAGLLTCAQYELDEAGNVDTESDEYIPFASLIEAAGVDLAAIRTELTKEPATPAHDTEAGSEPGKTKTKRKKEAVVKTVLNPHAVAWPFPTTK